MDRKGFPDANPVFFILLATEEKIERMSKLIV